MADLPTPGAPLIHMIPFPDPSPFPHSQSFTTFCAALRVAGWHFGAGYRASEFNSASNETRDSRVKILPRNNDQDNDERSGGKRTLGVMNVVDCSISDIAEVATCNVTIAYNCDGMVCHGRWEEEQHSHAARFAFLCQVLSTWLLRHAAVIPVGITRVHCATSHCGKAGCRGTATTVFRFSLWAVRHRHARADNQMFFLLCVLTRR